MTIWFFITMREREYFLPMFSFKMFWTDYKSKKSALTKRAACVANEYYKKINSAIYIFGNNRL